MAFHYFSYTNRKFFYGFLWPSEGVPHINKYTRIYIYIYIYVYGVQLSLAAAFGVRAVHAAHAVDAAHAVRLTHDHRNHCLCGDPKGRSERIVGPKSKLNKLITREMLRE